MHYQRFVSTIPTRNDTKNILTHNYTDHLIDRIYRSARNDTKNILTYRLGRLTESVREDCGSVREGYGLRLHSHQPKSVRKVYGFDTEVYG